jgi:putative membrane protein
MPDLVAAPTESPWAWHVHPEIVGGIALLAVAYALAVRILGSSHAPVGSKPATAKQIGLFSSGILLLWLAAASPLHDIAEGYLFSAHMVQHIVLMMIVPPLLLLGTPKWLFRTLIGRGRAFAALRWLTKPVPALVFFNLMVAFIHWPAVVELQVTSELGHGAIHLLILSASTLMWWPVIGPLPEMVRLSEPAKMFYLFVTSLLPTIPASFLTFASGVLYHHYETVPRLWGLSAQTDQMISGLIMKIGGGLLLWSVITVVFFRWYAREERQQVDEVSWDDFERELEAWDLRKK